MIKPNRHITIKIIEIEQEMKKERKGEGRGKKKKDKRKGQKGKKERNTSDGIPASRGLEAISTAARLVLAVGDVNEGIGVIGQGLVDEGIEEAQWSLSCFKSGIIQEGNHSYYCLKNKIMWRKLLMDF